MRLFLKTIAGASILACLLAGCSSGEKEVVVTEDMEQVDKYREMGLMPPPPGQAPVDPMAVQQQQPAAPQQ